MLKHSMFLMAYCLVIFTIFQVYAFPTEDNTLSPLVDTQGKASFGCPKENGNEIVEETPQKAAVRCCSKYGRNGCITPGSDKHPGPNGLCLNETTYEDAEYTCESLDMRLCTADELNNNGCCGTGCGFDTKLTWQKLENNAFSQFEELEDGAEKIKFMQKYGVDIVKHLLEFSKKNIAGMSNAVNDAYNAMTTLRVEIDSLNLEQFEASKSFISNFQNARINLQIVKRDVVSLASKIVLLCKNIESTIKNWQPQYATILLKNQFKQLKRLVEETKKKLESAKDKFDPKIIKGISKDMIDFHQTIEKALDNSTPQYGYWTKLIKKSYPINKPNVLEKIGQAVGTHERFKIKPTTLGMVFAKIFECHNECSGVSKTTTEFMTETYARDVIKHYKERIHQFANAAKFALGKVKDLDKEATKVVMQTNQKIELANDWLDEADNVDTTISDEEMKVVTAFQDEFEESLVGLRLLAEDFYATATSTSTDY